MRVSYLHGVRLLLCCSISAYILDHTQIFLIGATLADTDRRPDACLCDTGARNFFSKLAHRTNIAFNYLKLQSRI